VNTASDGSAPARPFLYRHCQRFLDEAARLAEMDPAPEQFYHQFLQRVRMGTGAAAAAVWGRSPAGVVQVECQLNLAQVGLENADAVRASHDELIRQAFQKPQVATLPPRSGTAAACNSTDFLILLAPILVDQQVAGLVEVWLDPSSQPQAQAVFAQFLAGMAGHASRYHRNRQRQSLNGQYEVWLRLEAFCQHIHDSLDLPEVACTVANDGRQLIGCDRLSVAGRRGSRTVVEAVSGVDTIDRRSNQVRRMNRLCDQVLAWGEPLVYRGVPDESLPPDVLHALNDYLADANSKLLAVRPLGGEQMGRKPRFVLLMEGFEPDSACEPWLQRLEVVGRHARSALENAAEVHRLPLRWLMRPLGELQECLGGAAAVWTVLLLLALIGLFAALIGVPYPLKMDAAGQLLPRERRWVYSPIEGQVVRFEPGVQPGAGVAEGQPLVLMYDTELELKLTQLANEVAGLQEDIAALAAQQTSAPTDADRFAFGAEKKQKEYVRGRKLAELRALRERTHADEARPGCFWLRAPIDGTVLSWDFRERLTNRFVKPSDPLLRLGDRERGWEVELKVPHTHISQVLEAFAAGGSGAELDVDLLLTSLPTRTFRGKLARDQVAAEAGLERDGESTGPVVRASVRIDGPDIAAEERIPPELLVTGTAVHGKIRCGDRSMGYALFHGVWEFVCEKVLFF
jgi:hypothetical protein